MLTVVTGAAGFIGSQARRRAQPRRDHRDPRGRQPRERRQGEEPRRRRDRRLPRQARIPRRSSNPGGWTASIDAILHQGACSDTMETDGRYVMENNYAYSKALFDWCQDEEVPLIYASSAAVYGAGREFGEARENEEPLNVYAYSKFLFDQYVRKRHARTRSAAGRRACATSTSTARTRRTRGAWPRSPSTPSTSSAPRGAVKLFVGSDGYGDGEQQRDFVHVDDVVERQPVAARAPRGLGHLQLRHRARADLQRSRRGGRSTRSRDVDLSIEELVEKGFIEYIPFPAAAGRQVPELYPGGPRAGCARRATTARSGRVEEGVAGYVRELMKT